jgi:hypothetical protein
MIRWTSREPNPRRRAIVTPLRIAIAVALALLAALQWKQFHRPSYKV